jgi:peptidoglycan/LPS O-acetylase OafA/YrhL
MPALAGPHYHTATALLRDILPRTSIHLTTEDKNCLDFKYFASLPHFLWFCSIYSATIISTSDFSKNYFAFGNHGVDVFFVLSGFVITYTAHPEKGSLYFMKRRAARIIPLYWLLTFGVGLLSIIRPDFLLTTTFNINNLLLSLAFIPYIKESGLTQPILFLGWTLNYEMFFMPCLHCLFY